DGHAALGELEVATLRLDGHLAAYVVALADSPAYRVFDGRFAPKWRLYSPGRRLEVAVVEHARRRSFRELDWMSSVAPEKLVARTQDDPRWAQPRIASWSIWTVVQAIGTASAFGAGQLPTACYTMLCAAGCAAVVFLGWRHGSREFGRLDAVCVTLAAEGVALLAVATWVPALIPVSWAVAVSVATDFLAYLPTFYHAWRRPSEEPWIPYAMFGAAAALVLLVADYRILVGVIYPTYLFAADAAMVIMIVASPHYAAPLPSAGRSRPVLAEPPMRLSVTSAQWRPVTGRDWRQPDLVPRGMP